MKIYTRGGDEGETSLFGAGRVGKGHPRVEAIGAVDELNAVLGWASSQLEEGSVRDRLTALQHDLFALGAALASPTSAERGRASTPSIPTGRAKQMEQWIDEAADGLPPLERFVLPGGTSTAAALHVARTVCRRAERAVVRLAESEDVAPGTLPYLNRLSDLLFMFARLENHRAGTGDVEWVKG
ncbi:MAG TPA: cob(I)yrinic acid a,c-diamide adenosyltransferase [Longimicrobiales bacterium]|nr:cob(I)yrinic acid a,c-diamide adenosyltransferase [Longimicrobiales bacterium]